METPPLSRRTFVAGVAAAGGAALGAPALEAAEAAKRRKRKPKRRRAKPKPKPKPLPPIGAGGEPMSLPALAALAGTAGAGEPLMIVDLAALDRNLAALLAWGRQHDFDYRPALKTLESPGLCAYVLERIPEPRGLIHHLRTVDAIVGAAPAGTDLLMGYPPTVGELRAYLAGRPPRKQKPHRLRILVDSVPLLEELAAAARSTRRPLPLDVALEIDSGAGRGGMNSREEISAAIAVLKGARDRLRLGALLCYDAAATVSSNPAFLQTVAEYAQARMREAVAQLAAEASDVVDVGALILNGPGSTNYRNWAGARDAANEFSPGSALLYPNYLDAGGYDMTGFANASVLCAPVLRVTSPGGTVPLLQIQPPASNREEVLIKAGGWPTGNNPKLSKLVWPEGLDEDAASGGRGANSSGAISAPKGSLRLGDYVLLRAEQITEALDYFGAIHAAREGTTRRVWPNVSRWSGVTTGS